MAGSRQIADLVSSLPGLCEPFENIPETVSVVETYRPFPVPRKAVLVRAIESEIIPRLMLAHRAAPTAERRRLRKAGLVSTEDVAEFVRIAVQHDTTVVHAYVDALIEQGATIEIVFSKLFAPAARQLGELWEQDRCNFADVTIGLSRIQQLVHTLGSAWEAERERRLADRSALLVTMPGEQHSLGLIIVEEYFRKAGWTVWAPCNLTEQQVVDAVQQERFDILGFSVTCEVPVARLSELINCVREKSLNRNIRVMVGGRPFNQNPDLVGAVGADATDHDGSNAVTQFEKLAERCRTH